MKLHVWRPRFLAAMTLVLVMGVACGGAAPPTQAPTSAATPANTPLPAATVTPKPSDIVSARDQITLVIDSEPVNLNSLIGGGGISGSIASDNMVDPLTWQSGDDLRIVPTSATESWEQLAPDKWRFQLRQGVKFHNGEEWDAQAALPSLAFQGIGTNDNSSFAYTGGFQAEAVDKYVLDIKCEESCPIFPNTAFFLEFQAPDYFTTSTEEELVLKTVGLGPYQHVDWQPGVSVTMEAYDDYVPAGDHFEFQKPFIRQATWLWRGEKTVAAAMVQTGEADIAWDVGVDSIEALPEGIVRSGGSAETFTLRVNMLWHPELKKQKVRLAMAHAINCQELVDTLYGGYPRCLGNIIWPGVIGATEENTAPFEYNPDLARQLLQEANYNPDNLITITGRGTRIPKNVEVYEAIQGYLEDVGMNVKINIVEASVWREMRNCGIGKAVNEVLEAQGKDPSTDEPTLADMQAAIDKGGANCPIGDLMDDEPSNETLDFGRQANRYMNCRVINSLFCDPTPGGIQEQIGPALAASGKERQKLLQAIADRHRAEIPHLPGFELPVFYAVDSKLNWEPRFDRRVRVSTMWFSE
jgi:peptide/nickel transport system substrate-binding protein